MFGLVLLYLDLFIIHQLMSKEERVKKCFLSLYFVSIKDYVISIVA